MTSRPIDSPSAGSPSTGKGRPTPKRSEAQRVRRGGPVPPPPRTRKEAAQRARDEAKAARTQVREGRALLPRDAGPVRALVRDVVDSRRSLGTLMLPLALVLLLAQASGNRRVLDIALGVWLVGILALVTDLVLTARALRRRLREHFPEEHLRGHVAYGLLRTTVFRRWRIPAPTTSPGRR
ncbi:MAG: DUF3043 domain-containing protein [Actinomycetota bacterium]|nr:DUF3043 domain-containing protein [Actinomycetota bacterium]